VDDLRVDTDEQVEVGIPRGDVLRRVGQRVAPTELLVADEVGVFGVQLEEQLGAGLEAVVRTVVDDAGQIWGGAENTGEMSALRRHRGAS
jgi:hypothetical protein